MGSALRRAIRPVGRALTARWAPHSRLFLVGENADWVIDHELAALATTARTLGFAVADPRLLPIASRQAVFYGSQFALLERWRPTTHRVGTAYFHGRPGTPGMPEFDTAYRTLCEHHAEIDRIQVSHSEFEQIVLASGIDPGKVFRIPIGIDAALFRPAAAAERAAARRELAFPEDAFVVGSFQKDGVGWGDGLDPKLVKGPDVLVAVLAELHTRVPELHVLLSGPARGYVIAGLERLGIPYVHRLVPGYEHVGRLYHALDAYVVTSRQEGGPKGVLESMASGVPLVTTRVGQAMDLVEQGRNGWLVDVEDAEGLAQCLALVAAAPPELSQVVAAGLETAAGNTYEAQAPLWRAFLGGFVEPS